MTVLSRKEVPKKKAIKEISKFVDANVKGLGAQEETGKVHVSNESDQNSNLVALTLHLI